MNLNKSRLKCYFAFGCDIINKSHYVEMLKACLESAKRNTLLELHCLYDGRENDDLYNILMEYNVKTKIVTIPFYDKISDIYTEEYMLNKFGIVITENSLRSRFLRMMISEYEKDEYFLYCDTDILFLQNITLDDFTVLPKSVGVCPEFERSNNYNYFNAGVMLINTAVAKEKYKIFINMIENGVKAKTECCDQGYLNDLYENEYDKLPLEYNWKPYWGINKDVKILHFHGIKPNEDSVDKKIFLSSMLKKYDAINAYFYYYDMYTKYVTIDYNTCFNRLLKDLIINFPFDDNKSIKKKMYKILYICIVFNIIIILLLFVLFR